MAEETLYCPSCNQKVRVPEELLGQPVQCPLCRLIFTAPVRGGMPPAQPPQVMPAPPTQPAPLGGYPPQAPYYGPPMPGQGLMSREAAQAVVRGPAVGMLVTGIIGLIVNTLGLVMIGRMMLSGPEAMLDSLEQTLPPGPLLDAMKESFTPAGLLQNLVMHGIFLVVCILICQGAMQMLRLRSYWLVVVASVLAMMNIENCCCVLGLPFGIWSLVVLFQSGVRGSFE